jgi:hypothetical protein
VRAALLADPEAEVSIALAPELQLVENTVVPIQRMPQTVVQAVTRGEGHPRFETCRQ